MQDIERRSSTIAKNSKRHVIGHSVSRSENMTMVSKACFAFARMALAEELVVFCDTCKEFLAYYNMRYGVREYEWLL